MSPKANNRLGRTRSITSQGETVSAFIPPSLPPDPPLDMAGLYPLLERATHALGKLDGIETTLPNLDLFLYYYSRKEALLSSQIEGTQSSFSDLLLHENDQLPSSAPLNDDVTEVSAYMKAMDHGLKRLRAGFPLSLRLIREIHEILLSGSRGQEKQPGEFRDSQNWVGGTRPGNALFVPPPPEELMNCLGPLEIFLHDDSHGLPLLIKAGLVHVQFETIHPFSDGNGRLGRLLITLMLCNAGRLQEPSLYLSLYLKTHRSTYYHLLQAVRDQGVWEEWLAFFLTGIEASANNAVETAIRLQALFKQDTLRIETLGRAAPNGLRLHQYLQAEPIASIPEISTALSLTRSTVSKAIAHLEKLGIVQEITERQRDRLYAYNTYLAILSEGTEPLPRM